MASITIPKYPVIIPLRPEGAQRQQTDQKRRGPVNVETNGYVVRSLCSGDISEQVLEWFNTPKMLSGLNLGNLNFTIARLKSFTMSFDNYKNYFLGIFYGEHLVGFYTIDINLLHRTGSITTGIGNSEYVGKNTLRLTIDALTDYFYKYRDIEKFTARILSKNYAMIFNFRNAARFTLEAHLKKECRAPDGSRVDLLVFASHKETPATRHDDLNKDSIDK